MEPVFVHRRGLLVRADGFPPYVERYEAAGIDIGRLLDASQEPAA